MTTKWTTVRLPVSLYDRLRDRREQTNIPISKMVRVAIEVYLEPGDESKLFLKLLKENLDFANEVRKIILAK